MRTFRKKKKHQSEAGNGLLRTLERNFKRFLSLLLRLIIGSRSISISPESSFQRILVIRQHNQLGDMLCVVPLLRGLREKYPMAFIALMASPVNYEPMVNNPYVNSVMKYDKRVFLERGWIGWKALFDFVGGIRNLRFDLALVPSTVSMSFTSDLLAYLSGASVRIGIVSLNGKPNASAFCFNYGIKPDWRLTPEKHQTLRNLEIGLPLGINEKNLDLEIALVPSELQTAKRYLENDLKCYHQIITYHPGAGKIANRWDAARFAIVANTLATEYNALSLITCGPMDDDPVAQMEGLMSRPYRLVKGKSIRDVAAILSGVNLVITNDTGMMHVAAAVGTPVLSLFGPTDPYQWAPHGSRNRYISGENADIDNISVEQVLSAARRMLGPLQDDIS